MLLMAPHREVRGNLGAPRRELIWSCKRILGEFLELLMSSYGSSSAAHMGEIFRNS